MRILAVRSIPLSTQTYQAWKAAGVDFTLRRRRVEEIMAFPYDLVINLGNSSFNPRDTERVINLGTTIEDLVTPGGTRRLLADLIPPEPTEYPCDVWLKGPGRAGHNKSKRKLRNAEPQQLREWDIQVHIEGQEYRLITVGSRIVQQHRRSNVELDGARTYRWEPKTDTPHKVRVLARLAASRLDGPTIIGWDIILSDTGRPFLLEGNSCPGVNEATAKRIVKELERGHNAQ